GDRFVFGEDDQAVEDADRGLVFLHLEVDALVGAVGRLFVAVFDLLVDELPRGVFVGRLDRGAVAFEVAFFIFLQEEAAALPQPGLDFLFEVEFFAVLAGGVLQFGDDQFAEVVDPGKLLGQGVEVFAGFVFGLDGEVDEDRRPRQRDAGRIGAAAALVAAAAATGEKGGNERREKDWEDETELHGAGTLAAALDNFSRPGPGRTNCHSTVTVFARLRGWSTLRPRARAMS